MILDLIQNSLGSRELNQIGRQLGTDPQQTQQADIQPAQVELPPLA